MTKYMVIGDPVAHSRSPGMQNAAFAFYGMGQPYGRCHVRPEELPEFIRFARRELLGVNLTVPHKAAVLPLIDEIEETARLCRSVNTLLIRGGKISGFSTDGIGLERALEENFHRSIAGASCCFLGAGGAVWATAVHLARRGAAAIRIINRTQSHAEALAGVLRSCAPHTEISCVAPADRDAVRNALEKSDFLIQGTSLGLHDGDPPPVDLSLLDGSLHLAVFDAIYRPTPLLARARSVGLPFADGAEMLIYQGAASFELWTKRPAPLAEMRRGFLEGVSVC